MRNYLKKIAQIVYEYSKSQKVVDKEFITKVSELLMKHFGVDHYINDVFLADMNQNYLCGGWNRQKAFFGNVNHCNI